MSQGLFGILLFHSIHTPEQLLNQLLNYWYVPVHNKPPSRDLCSSETAEVALDYPRIHVWTEFRMTNI